MLPPSAILTSRGDAFDALAVTLAHDPQYDWWDAYLRKRPTSRRRDESAWAGRADSPAAAPVAPKGRHASDTPELPGGRPGTVEQHGSGQPLGPSAARRGKHAAEAVDERSTASGPAALGGDEADVGALISEAIESLSDKRLAFVLAGRLGVGADPLTLEALGQKLGVTRERVRQLQEKGLAQLARGSVRQGSLHSLLSQMYARELAELSLEAQADHLSSRLGGLFLARPQLVIEVVLRAGGVPKARARTLALLAEERARSRARAERLHQNALASRERPDRVMRKWLADATWPATLGTPPSRAEMGRVREVQVTGRSGSFESAKLGRAVSFESHLEMRILLRLERSDLVAWYQEQPLAVAYRFDGEARRYFPDVFVALADGRGLLAEIKPLWQVALSVNRAKADAARQLAHERGWGWVTIAGTRTDRDLAERVVSVAAYETLSGALANGAVLRWRDVNELRRVAPVDNWDVAAFALQSGARLDLMPYRLSRPV